MALTANFEEVYNGRTIKVDRDNFSQDFGFYICGNFWDEAPIDPIYGPDEDVVALQYAYSIVPPSRFMPLYADPTSAVYLTLNSLSIKRLAIDVWFCEVQYSTPTKEQGGGSGGNDTPQGSDPEWSPKFAQLEFNVTAQQEPVKVGLSTNACQWRVGRTGNVPYPSGQPAPIGQTNDEIAGSLRYSREFEFGIQKYFWPNELTFAYIRRLYRMSTTFNNAIYYGFPTSSVLFLEASAAGDQYEQVPFNFSFKMKPNFKFVQAGPTELMDPDEDDEAKMFDKLWDPFFPDTPAGPAPGGAYSGWAEVDYRYAAGEEEKLLVQKPILRTIHQKYGPANFARLDP